ncbi:MAG: hypothetical protein DLM59_09125 [Pseudonocardiales bacterium]|nr:MAG: hypothetical protein DLM59_09125 [Pseudonocardiales bacterium]
MLALTGCSHDEGRVAYAPYPSPTASPSVAAPSAPPAPSPLAARRAGAVPRAAVRASGLPLSAATYDATQVITVVAASPASTGGTLQAWDRTAGGWVPRGPAVHAYLGDQGITTHPSETRSATPAGSFTLTQAFGRAGDPGTALPYFRTDSSDWWVTDVTSRSYNTHYRCSSACPFDTGLGENLYRAGFLYTYAVVIDYNRRPVTPGAGSAFFLHVTEFKPTTGCVSIPQASLVSIMRWLSPSAHPRIIMGVA